MGAPYVTGCPQITATLALTGAVAYQGVIKTTKVKLEPPPPPPLAPDRPWWLVGWGGVGGDRLTKGSPKILQRNSPGGQEIGRSLSTDQVRGPGTWGGAAQSSQTPSASGTLLPCQQPRRAHTLKMAPAACGAGRLPCYFPRCPRCQEKPIIRNAIGYIYLSLSPPASSSRLPARPAEPPSPSGHTSLWLTPVTTCPSLAPRRSPPPEPLPSGGHEGTTTFSAGTARHAHGCCHVHLTGRPWAGVSGPKPRAGGGCLWPLSATAPSPPARASAVRACPQSPPRPSAGTSGRGAHGEVSHKLAILGRQEVQGERARLGGGRAMLGLWAAC